MKELPKTYNPAEHEAALYQKWEASGGFAPKDDSKAASYSIILPPPNVTGTLHIGHAMMLALQDILIRYHRMRGDKTLWLPGLDHAAIATQNVVEKKLKKENVPGRRTRHELGREEFLKVVDQFVEESKKRILAQMRAMGASCDWSRLAYTLDEQRSRAVKEMFVRLHRAGLLYRGNRIVNWCPRCQSTLADDEVEYIEQKTPFYYLRYGPVVIGTARPETKFADKILVVHPKDKRYQDLVGKELTVEWIEGPIEARVIADSIIDPEFGTGAMTITPAHSFEDFELAQKYDLPVELIIDEAGKLTDLAGEFAGQKARDARAAIIDKLQKKGLVERIDADYVHNLSVCYRCGTAVEPLPKLQWFVAVSKPFRDGKSLKDLARQAVASGQIQIIPKRFEKTYFQWIDHLRDWCISRQIWFGHRLPVWYRKPRIENREWRIEEAEVYVGVESPEGEGWKQDPDTLDTWFSSGMWTFSTLGWPFDCAQGKPEEICRPKPDSDLATFHPTSVLETGYDILFFWVARMIMMTEFALGEIPFKTVYLHGLVRDMAGRKMSKSLGNVIDPLDGIEKYGADAVRLSLFMGTAAGTDIKLNEAKIAGYRNFANKIWNIGRFVLLHCGEAGIKNHESRIMGKTEADRAILGGLNRVIEEVTSNLEKFQFHLAAERLYHFIWHELADSYIETAKEQMGQRTENREQKTENRNNEEIAENTQAILLHIYTTCLRLLHPFMPYVSEAIWQELPGHADEPMLMTASWPKSSK